MVCLRLKRHVLNCFIFSDYDSLRDVRKKKQTKKNDRIVNIDKEKYKINSLHVYSCYDFICKEIFVVWLAFEKSIQIYCIHSQFLYVKKTKINIIIASIFITLTEINNETHYVAKKIKTKNNKKKQNKQTKTKIKQDKTAPIGFAHSL